jgi:hypothetical protein
MAEMAEKAGLIEKVSGDWIAIGEKFSAKSHIERKLAVDPAFKSRFGRALVNVLLAS